MKKLSLMLAYRYLIGSKNEKSISIMVIICFLGIFIGSFALALVASVMNGFEKVTHEKMKSIQSHVTAHAHGETLDFNKIAPILEKEFDAIQAFSPHTIKQAIVQSGDDENFSVVALKGVDPLREHTVSKIQEKIIASVTPQKTLEAILKENKVIIGETLAKNLTITPTDTITIFFPKEERIKRKRIKLNQEDIVVGGIFKTGIDEFDNSLIICSLATIEKLFPESGATKIGIELKKGADEGSAIKKIKSRFNIEAYSWKELYPALVEALKLEKYAMFLILALITLVASMSIISLLFMQIIRKRPDIAVLKAMGMSDNDISRIFLWLGMTIAAIGSAMGLFFAFIAGHVLQKYPFIQLPDAYYMTHLPCKMEWSIFVTVFAVVMILSFFSTWIPTRKTRSINISEVLKFEG